MSPTERRAVNKSEPYYTNEDVAILHNIVSHAEELLSVLPERERIPTNALFHAYYAILPKIGLDADHDNRYARVLFKIGGRRDEATLYEKFESVLAQMGIDIQFDYIDEGNRSRSPLGESSTLLSAADAHAPSDVSFKSSKYRRNSETAAMLPVGFGREESTHPRARSSSPHSVLYNTANAAYGYHGYTPASARQNGAARSPKEPRLEQHSRDIKAWVNTKPQRIDPNRSRNVANPKSALDLAHESFYGGDGPTRLYSMAVATDVDQQYHQRPYDASINSEEEISSVVDFTGETEDFKITRFHDRHDKSVLRALLTKWHQQTSWLLHRVADLEVFAENYDRRVLLKQSFDGWRSHFLERQQIHEAQRILLEQEHQAVHHRIAYLRSKYFNRWVSAVARESEKTEAARQHILTLRLFNTWRAHTVQNEVTVRRHITKKFLGLWKEKRLTNADGSQRAAVHYKGALAKRIFWDWFWRFCEQRAPQQRKDKLKRAALSLWHSKLQSYSKKVVSAEGVRKTSLQRTYLLHWAERRCVAERYAEVALVRYERNRKSQMLTKFVRSHWEVVAAAEAARIEKENLTAKYVKLWRLRVSQEIISRQYNQAREIRVAVKLFRLGYRRKQHRDELQRQFFNRWRLAVAAKKVKEVVREHMLRKFFPRLLNTSRLAVTAAASQTRTADQIHDHALKSSSFRQWRQRLQSAQTLQERTIYMSFPGVVNDCLSTWVEAKRKTDQMKKWAADAEFYLIGKRYLSKWHRITEASKREKRKAVYAQVRRQNKMNLAKSMLEKWQNKNREVQNGIVTAREVLSTKTAVVAESALRTWRARSHDLVGLNAYAKQAPQQKSLGLWRTRLVKAARDEAIAEEADDFRLRLKFFKKWTRQALQYRAHQHLVSELLDKRAKRSLRLMLKHWQQSLESRQGAALLFDDNSGSTKVNPEEGKQSRRLKMRAPFEFGDEPTERLPFNLISPLKPRPPSPPKPAPALPAYLNTPSRRSTLGRLASAVSTTPKGTPSVRLSTPFDRQLRAQLTGNPLSAYTRRTAAKPLSKLRAFDDLVEEGTQTDDES